MEQIYDLSTRYSKKKKIAEASSAEGVPTSARLLNNSFDVIFYYSEGELRRVHDLAKVALPLVSYLTFKQTSAANICVHFVHLNQTHILLYKIYVG